MDELLDLLHCDQYNWSKRKFCTNKAIVRVLFTNPPDMWLVCNCHMMNLAKYDQLQNATWKKIKSLKYTCACGFETDNNEHMHFHSVGSNHAVHFWI